MLSKSGLLLTTVAMCCSVQALAAQQPLHLYGNLGYFYTYSQADGGAEGENTHLVANLNGASYLWQPWFATYVAGATVSSTRSAVEANSKESQLLSGSVNFSLLPQSRFPLTLTYLTSNNLDADATDNRLLGMGIDYRTRLFSARQSVISRGGDRLDFWYNNRLRASNDLGDYEDNTFGGKLKTRFRNHNLYANASYQEREVGMTGGASVNKVVSAMHNYAPSSRFYVKTLGSSSQIENRRDFANGSFFANSETSINQVSSFFYWRPEYRPYNMTGAVRLHQRTQTAKQEESQATMSGSLAGSYRINRRTQAVASVNASLLDAQSPQWEASNSRVASSTQNLNVSYQADSLLYRGFSYHWFANGGVGNTIGRREYKEDDAWKGDNSFEQNLNAGVGHGLDQRWVTGNRSSLKASLTQIGREIFETEEYGSIMTLSHTGSLSWQEELRSGSSYMQLSAVDTRSFFDESYESQIVNLQATRSMPISHLSGWSGSVSLQSSRRDTGIDTGKSFINEFLTASTGRLSYQHGRLFGIYRLEFKTKLDLTATLNRSGGDRKQADWEGKFSYRIGKLNTALLGRWYTSDSGLGGWSTIFQLNRSF